MHVYGLPRVIAFSRRWRVPNQWSLILQVVNNNRCHLNDVHAMHRLRCFNHLNVHHRLPTQQPASHELSIGYNLTVPHAALRRKVLIGPPLAARTPFCTIPFAPTLLCSTIFGLGKAGWTAQAPEARAGPRHLARRTGGLAASPRRFLPKRHSQDLDSIPSNSLERAAAHGKRLGRDNPCSTLPVSFGRSSPRRLAASRRDRPQRCPRHRHKGELKARRPLHGATGREWRGFERQPGAPPATSGCHTPAWPSHFSHQVIRSLFSPTGGQPRAAVAPRRRHRRCPASRSRVGSSKNKRKGCSTKTQGKDAAAHVNAAVATRHDQEARAAAGQEGIAGATSGGHVRGAEQAAEQQEAEQKTAERRAGQRAGALQPSQQQGSTSSNGAALPSPPGAGGAGTATGPSAEQQAQLMQLRRRCRSIRHASSLPLAWYSARTVVAASLKTTCRSQQQSRGHRHLDVVKLATAALHVGRPCQVLRLFLSAIHKFRLSYCLRPHFAEPHMARLQSA